MTSPDKKLKTSPTPTPQLSDIRLSVPMPQNLPAALVRRALTVQGVKDELISELNTGKSLVVIGDPLEAAAAAIAIANRYGMLYPMSYIGYVDATKFMNMKIQETPLIETHNTFDDSLFGSDSHDPCEVVIWSMLSYVNDKVAHEIDAVIGGRLAEGLTNIITGWNTTPERRVSAAELRSFETRATAPTGYPMLNIYANNEQYMMLIDAGSVL